MSFVRFDELSLNGVGFIISGVFILTSLFNVVLVFFHIFVNYEDTAGRREVCVVVFFFIILSFFLV